VTVATTTGCEVFDIESGATFTAPPAMSEPAAFWTVVLASLANTVTGYDAAQGVAGDVGAQHNVNTGGALVGRFRHPQSGLLGGIHRSLLSP